jgi:hypothetical protein
MWFRCERCNSERRDEIGSGGELLKRIYVYSPGYAGAYSDYEVKPMAADFRLMLLNSEIMKTRSRRSK